MNTISKIVIVAASACLFFPAYAQTDTEMEQHIKTIEDISGGHSDKVRQHAPEVQKLIRDDLRKRNPSMSEEELNKETNATISEGIKLFGKMKSEQAQQSQSKG